MWLCYGVNTWDILLLQGSNPVKFQRVFVSLRQSNGRLRPGVVTTIWKGSRVNLGLFKFPAGYDSVVVDCWRIINCKLEVRVILGSGVLMMNVSNFFILILLPVLVFLIFDPVLAVTGRAQIARLPHP